MTNLAYNGEKKLNLKYLSNLNSEFGDYITFSPSFSITYQLKLIRKGYAFYFPDSVNFTLS